MDSRVHGQNLRFGARCGTEIKATAAVVVRVERHRGRGQSIGRPNFNGRGAPGCSVIGNAIGELWQRADRDRIHELQFARATDRAIGSRVEGDFPAAVVRARANAQVDATIFDEPPNALVGGTVQGFAKRQVGTTWHDEQNGVIEERCVMLDVIGHDRSNFVCRRGKLLRDRPHHA